MNVLIVSMTEFFGGGESYLINLVEIISKQHQSYLLVSSKDLYHRLKGTSFIKHKKWSGYSCYMSYIIAICRLIKANKIDIIILLQKIHFDCLKNRYYYSQWAKRNLPKCIFAIIFQIKNNFYQTH